MRTRIILVWVSRSFGQGRMNGMNHSATPHWPALYDPFLELRNIAHRNDTQPDASYLYDPNGEPFRSVLGVVSPETHAILVLLNPQLLCAIYLRLHLPTRRHYVHFDVTIRALTLRILHGPAILSFASRVSFSCLREYALELYVGCFALRHCLGHGRRKLMIYTYQ